MAERSVGMSDWLEQLATTFYYTADRNNKKGDSVISASNTHKNNMFFAHTPKIPVSKIDNFSYNS